MTVSPGDAIAGLPPLIATSVVRGSEQGQSHGGVFLLNPARQAVYQVLNWNTVDIDWTGRGWDRGLRGIAFHDGEIYLAASDELFVFDQRFRRQRSFRNPYLRHCHEIVVFREVLYLTSTGFDSILAFDLARQRFSWGIVVAVADGCWHAHRFDPNSEAGPSARNHLHLNNVTCDERGLTFSGLRTHGIVSLGASLGLVKQVDLPEGTHNARLFADGVLFNDTRGNHLRFVTRDGCERAFAYPVYADAEIEFAGVDNSKVARQGFGRGLCVLGDQLVATGSSPSTVTVFDLQRGTTVLSVNFSMDIRNAIHGLEVWPFDWPKFAPQAS